MAAKTTTAIDNTGRLSSQSLIADPRPIRSLRMLNDETPACGMARYYRARYFLPCGGDAVGAGQ